MEDLPPAGGAVRNRRCGRGAFLLEAKAMRRSVLVVGVAALAAVIMMGAWADRVEAARGELRGTFVRRAELALGETEYLGIVVRQAGRDETTTLVIPRRREDLMGQARKLHEGDVVEVTFAEEDGQKWVRIIETAGGEGERREGREREERGDRERAERKEMTEEEVLLRRLLERLEKLEAELKELREENRRLREGRDGGRDVKREGGDRERDVKREGGDREREVKREGDREVNREGGDREREVKREGDREVRREGGDREREVKREGGDRKRAEKEGERSKDVQAARGRFIRLAEQKLGNLEHLAVVVQLDGQEKPTTFFVPMRRVGEKWVRDEEIAARAKRLREGQTVEIGWRWTEGQRFIVKLAL